MAITARFEDLRPEQLDLTAKREQTPSTRVKFGEEEAMFVEEFTPRKGLG